MSIININIAMGCTSYNICNLCLKASTSVYSVCIQDNFHLLCNIREFKNVCKEYNPYSFLVICEICLVKYQMFVKCQNDLFLSEYLQRRMQGSSGHIEDTNCTCEHCSSRFGNLPLLAEVIEKFERRTPSEQSSSSSKPVVEQNVTDELTKSEVKVERITEFPSTSSASSASASSSSNTETRIKKVMKCSYCEKIFTHKGDLNKHIRSHTKEKPFSCPVCNRQFAHTSNLARHIRVHSGDKPFHCDRCNRDFSRKDKLLMHQKTKLCMNAVPNSRT